MEERQYALEKGRALPSSSLAATSSSLATETAAFGASEVGTPYVDVYSQTMGPHSTSVSSALPMEGGGLRGAGHIFLTKYGRGRTAKDSASSTSNISSSSTSRGTFHVVSASHALPCRPHPGFSSFLLTVRPPFCAAAQVTPGPGSYDPDAKNNITSILSSNADKPQPNFRSRTSRFAYNADVGRFHTADPLHLEPHMARPNVALPAAPSPGTFRRGHNSLR